MSQRGVDPTSTNDISRSTYSTHHKPGHMKRLDVLSQDSDRGYWVLPDEGARRARLARTLYILFNWIGAVMHTFFKSGGRFFHKGEKRGPPFAPPRKYEGGPNKHHAGKDSARLGQWAGKWQKNGMGVCI